MLIQKLILFNLDDIQNKILENLKNKKVVGLGETGLDFFRGKENRTNQIESFMLHLFLSGEKNIPLLFTQEMQMMTQ